MPRAAARRLAVLLAVLGVLGGTPLVAQAIDGDVVETTTVTSSPPSVSRLVVPERPADEPALSAELGRELVVTIETPHYIAPPLVDPVTALLTDAYAWDERSERVEALQEFLGIATDGWYSNGTHEAHLAALVVAGLPADAVPTPVLPPGPDPDEWAALRDCESNGNYAITSRTGKYRGAYQFDRSTWNSVAERHAPQLVGVDPAAAAPADQDAMALALYSERGASPWPHCGRHLA